MFLIGSRVLGMFLLLVAGGVMACAHSSKPDASNDQPTPATTPGNQDRVPGEYLVSVQKGGDEALIRRVFASYSVRDVRPVSDNLFLLKIDQDPGPEAIKRK